MIDKSSYLEALQTVKNICKRYTFLSGELSKTDELVSGIDDYVFRVIFIGGFSSGKSAVLNRLVGRPLFKENQGPQTSAPAEVSWAPLESAEIYLDNGQRIDSDIATVTENHPDNTAFIAMHVNAPFLKRRPDLILVDFPGFDSNIEAHNKAISSYLQKGSAFLLLLPAKNGGLTESDRRFVREATHYPQSLACLLSKSDLVTTNQCQEILAYARRGLKTIYGVETPIEAISILPEQDPEFEAKLGRAIDGFNPQELFDITFAPAVMDILSASIQALEKYLGAARQDISAIDEKIAEASRRQQELAEQLERESRELEGSYHAGLIRPVMEKLEKTLSWNVDVLASAAMKGDREFSDTLQSLVRPVLAGIPGEINANLRDSIAGMTITLPDDTPEENSAIKDTLLNMVDLISHLPIFGGGIGKEIGRAAGMVLGRKDDKAPSVYSGVGTGILTGLVVSPIAGIITGLATLCMQIFGSQKAEMARARAREEARRQIENCVLPQVLARIEEQITPGILEMRNKMMDELKKRIGDNMAEQTQALESAKKERESRHAAMEKEIGQASQDMEVLKTLLSAQEERR